MSAPEFETNGLLPQQLGEVLTTRGAVLLRRLLPPELIETWKPRFEAAYSNFDKDYAEGKLTPQTVTQLYAYGHVRLQYLENALDWFGQILALPDLQRLLAGYFDRRAYFLVNNCAPRRQGPAHPDHAIAFHQDQEFIGPMRQAITIWLPLTPAGGDWPGLELLLDTPQHPLLHLGFDAARREEVIQQTLDPARLWRPELSPGDAIVFTPYTLHRTWLEPSMTQTRISSEIRLISAADRPLTRSQLIEVAF